MVAGANNDRCGYRWGFEEPLSLANDIEGRGGGVEDSEVREVRLED
jgi:hypothetical protein